MAGSPGAAELGQLYSAAFKAWAGVWVAWQQAAAGMWATVAEWATDEQRSVAAANMKQFEMIPNRVCTLAALVSPVEDLTDTPIDLPAGSVVLDPPAITAEMVSDGPIKGSVGLMPGDSVPFGGYRVRIVDRDDHSVVLAPVVNVHVVATP